PGNIKQAAAEAGRLQQVLGPVPQRPAQPVGKRNAETHFRPVQQRLRHHALGDPTQEPFRLSIADLEPPWQRPGEFDDSMIEQWWSRLKRYRHGSTIDLLQN